MKRSGDARRSAFHYCRVDRQVCVCDGDEIMRISTQTPIYAELEGKCARDAISFNGWELVIEEVA